MPESTNTPELLDRDEPKPWENRSKADSAMNNGALCTYATKPNRNPHNVSITHPRTTQNFIPILGACLQKVGRNINWARLGRPNTNPYPAGSIPLCSASNG